MAFKFLDERCEKFKDLSFQWKRRGSENFPARKSTGIRNIIASFSLFRGFLQNLLPSLRLSPKNTVYFFTFSKNLQSKWRGSKKNYFPYLWELLLLKNGIF